MEKSFLIRSITPADVPAVHALVCELAEFEKGLHEVTNSVEQILIDGFGENPIFGGMVVEKDGNIIGMAIYYFRYSTWKGKILYLEDIYIQPEYRRFGIGEALFKALEQLAHETHCRRITWQVLDWNESALKFYEKIGAEIDKNWWNGHLNLK